MRVSHRKGAATLAHVAFATVWASAAPEVARSEPRPEAPLPELQAGADESGRVTYGSAWFTAYKPNTAEDMLRLVPSGGAILDTLNPANAARGLGAGGPQVLINGRRFPGKANEITANLRRIASASVESIQLINGASDGISAQGNGTLVNVILRSSSTLPDTVTWEVNSRFNDAGRHDGLDGLVSFARSRDGWAGTLGFERNLWSPLSDNANRWSERTRDEAFFYPSGALQESRPQQWSRALDKRIFTAGLRFASDGGRNLDLNAFYQTLAVLDEDTTDFTRFAPSGTVTLRGTERHRRITEPFVVLELSANFNGPLGGGELDALVLSRNDRSRFVDFRNQERGGRVFELNFSDADQQRGEDILRAGWTMPVGSGMSLELGGELARNTFDQFLQVSFDLDANGLVEPVEIPTARAQVEEDRSEAFVTFRRSGVGRSSIEAGATYERSRIRTNYPFSPGRDLAYLRPRLDYRLGAPEAGQWRVTVERKVSQLNFTNFVPKFNVVDSLIDAGNPELLPERTWSYELGYQRRLPGDAGVLELRAFHDDISGAIDKVPLRDAVGLYSAQGNIASAWRQGAELKASVRLRPVGLEGGLLSVRYLWQQSEIEDAFTKLQRRLAGTAGGTLEIALRHDLQGQGASYGVSYRAFQDPVLNSDLLVTSTLESNPGFEAFVEKRLSRGVVLRLEGQNLGNARERQERTLYLVNAIDGAVLRRERFDERRDIRFALRLRGRF